MKKLAVVLGLALVAASASATIILQDSDWSTFAFYDALGTNGTLDSIVDIVADPGYEITVTVEDTIDSGAGYFYGYVEGSVDMGGIAGDVWQLRVDNTSPLASSQIFMVAVTNGVRVVGPTTGLLGAGTGITLDWDLTAATSIDSLNVWIGAATAFGGTTVTTMVPEPATFGLMALLGGGMIFFRKRFRS